jgi:hypothetical protein
MGERHRQERERDWQREIEGRKRTENQKQIKYASSSTPGTARFFTPQKILYSFT